MWVGFARLAAVGWFEVRILCQAYRMLYEYV